MTHFFNDQLLNAPVRIKASTGSSVYCLDKNEQSNDVSTTHKSKVLDAFMNSDWHRYPSTDLSDIESNVARYCGLQPENIVLSPGSANLITTLLNYFALNGKNIVINQPSYSLFEYHCHTYNIPFTPWMLNSDLEFDFQNIPSLDKDSVLIITSPNNPTGNSISKEHLEEILCQNPDTIVIVDAVYTEFGKHDFTPLVHKFPNLIVLRSFSKAFPMAGLRLGYLCANAKIAAVAKKLVLQFSINAFTLSFAREILFDQEFQEGSKQRVVGIISERERMKNAIQKNFSQREIKVFPSEGNFLLIRIHDESLLGKVMKALSAGGVKVLNTSHFVQLQNTFRVSVGNPHENEAFLRFLSMALNKEDHKSNPIWLDYFPVNHHFQPIHSAVLN